MDNNKFMRYPKIGDFIYLSNRQILQVMQYLDSHIDNLIEEYKEAIPEKAMYIKLKWIRCLKTGGYDKETITVTVDHMFSYLVESGSEKEIMAYEILIG